MTKINLELPVVDVSTCTSHELAQALVRSSCMLLTGHGVPAELQHRMREVSAAFFDLPEQEKERVRWPGTGMWQGWVPVNQGASDVVKEDSVPDLVEWFQLQEFEGFALWPERPAEMQEVWRAYFDACSGLASHVIRLLAEGLELPADDVPAWTERQFCNLAVNNYPVQHEAPRPGQLRLGLHTDENAITLLSANNAPGGLEVHVPGSEVWIPCEIPQDTLFLQAGDLLARWTNRLVHANIHRVVNPPLELAATSRRQSIVFFHYPDRDAVVTPAPSCVAATGNPALPPLHVWEHIIRNQKAFSAGERYSRLDDQRV